MAQYSPKSRPFESRWRPSLAFAMKVLLDIQAAWLKSDELFPVRKAVAVLLNIFGFDFESDAYFPDEGKGEAELSRRSVAEWFSAVGLPESECARLSPNRQEAEYNQVIGILCSILTSAAESWERVGPNIPSTEEVVQEVFREVVSGRFIIMTCC
jgi:hypothetical protein